jgi:hypothetical protein
MRLSIEAARKAVDKDQIGGLPRMGGSHGLAEVLRLG